MKKRSHFIRKKEQRTVPKKKKNFFWAVLLFMILLPYVCATFMGGVHSYEAGEYDSPIMVIRETDMGTERMPMEEYLIGALAASINPAYEPEALKAQAVILRTMVYKQYRSRDNKSSEEVNADKLQQAYMTPRRMKEYWGADFERYYDKLRTAVNETQGCIIQYENIAVDTPYFLLSAGRTRNGKEAFGSQDYPHLQAVESGADMMAQNYMCRYTYDKKQFIKKLEETFTAYEEMYGYDSDDISDGENKHDTSVANVITENQIASKNHKISENDTISGNQTVSENTVLADEENAETKRLGQPIRIRDLTLQRDSSQYVLTVRAGDRSVSGEFFRECFRLNSACFTIEEKGDAVELVTKGIGHGVGMSQYGANEMAKAGDDFMTILQHYFTSIQIQRN